MWSILTMCVPGATGRVAARVLARLGRALLRCSSFCTGICGRSAKMSRLSLDPLGVDSAIRNSLYSSCLYQLCIISAGLQQTSSRVNTMFRERKWGPIKHLYKSCVNFVSHSWFERHIAVSLSNINNIYCIELSYYCIKMSNYMESQLWTSYTIAWLISEWLL